MDYCEAGDGGGSGRGVDQEMMMCLDWGEFQVWAGILMGSLATVAIVLFRAAYRMRKKWTQ